MPYRLNNTIVDSQVYNKAQHIISQGGKPFLVFIDDLFPDTPNTPFNECKNCKSTGAIGLQWFVGGPFDAVPEIANKDDMPRATNYKDRWYKQITKVYRCPVCYSMPGTAPRHDSGAIAEIDRVIQESEIIL